MNKTMMTIAVAIYAASAGAAAARAGDGAFGYVSFKQLSDDGSIPAPEARPVAPFTSERQQALKKLACWHFGVDDGMCSVACDAQQDRIRGRWDWVGRAGDVYVYVCRRTSTLLKTPAERAIRACQGTVLFSRIDDRIVAQVEIGYDGRSDIRRTDPELACVDRVEPVEERSDGGWSPIPF